jgi:hypothetical protein
MTQNNLGTAYSDLPSGDRGDNLRRAIACYEAAVRGYQAVAAVNDAEEVREIIAKLREDPA